MSGFSDALRSMQQAWSAEDAELALARMSDIQQELAEVQAAWLHQSPPRHQLAAIRAELALEHERLAIALERSLERLRDLGPVVGSTIRTQDIQAQAQNTMSHYQGLEREWRRYVELEAVEVRA